MNVCDVCCTEISDMKTENIEVHYGCKERPKERKKERKHNKFETEEREFFFLHKGSGAQLDSYLVATSFFSQG